MGEPFRTYYIHNPLS